MGAVANADWNAIEALYRANKGSVLSIAKEHGVTEGAIRARAKKGGWVRDPEGQKREIVRARMSGVTSQVTNYEVRNVIASEAEQDIADMRAGLSVARACIRRLSDMVDDAEGPRDIKTIIEANKGAVETIRKIRGLDEERPEDKGLPAINVRFVDADASSD